MISANKLFSAAAVLGFALSGCTSLHHLSANMPTAPAAAADTRESPFVEAYLEYPGPPNRWAGPQSWVVHLTTRDTNSPSVTFSPSMLEPGLMTSARPTPPAYENLVGETARVQLAELAAAARTEASDFSGCMYPIRLRLVRADSTTLERQGCRGQSGWPIAMSRTVSQVIETAINDRQRSGAPVRALSSIH